MRRASGWTGRGTECRELHRNLLVLELAQDWKRMEERSKEKKEDKRKTGAFLKYVREDDEPVLVLVPHIKNTIAGAVDVHVSRIAKIAFKRSRGRMELLIHVQIGGVLEPFVDETDLARIALSCHLVWIYSVTRR